MNRTLPHPESPDAPKYWMYETGGLLAAAMKRYLESRAMTLRDFMLIQAYLRQWVESPAWDLNPHLSAEGAEVLRMLRHQVREARTETAIRRVVKLLVDAGMDPL